MWQSLAISLQLATCSSITLVILGLPCCWLIFRRSKRQRLVLETFLILPMVLPPTVLGYYLLAVLAPDSIFAKLQAFLPFQIKAFSFSGILLGSCLYSLPFVWQTIIHGYEKIPVEAFDLQRIYNLPAAKFWFCFILPELRQTIILALLFGFAHSLGEFGVILLIGGSIPGETLTAAIELYQLINAFEDKQANLLALCLLALALSLGLLINLLKLRN